MRIRDIFATAVQERIEPLVQVADRRPVVVQRELANLGAISQAQQLAGAGACGCDPTRLCHASGTVNDRCSGSERKVGS